MIGPLGVLLILLTVAAVVACAIGVCVLVAKLSEAVAVLKAMQRDIFSLRLDLQQQGLRDRQRVH